MKESNERFNGAEAIGQSHALVEMKVVDENDQEVPPGTIGEMVIRSPAIMKGYYKEKEKNRATFKNGWHHTGDLAIMDEERFYYFVDRKKDMIKTGAENVSSVEVEQWIAGYPKVAECVVVGLFHPRWIEAVTAFIVPSHGESLTGEEIIKYCYDEATFESQTAIDMQPEFFIGHFTLGLCLIYLGKPNHALEVLKIAKRLHRKHPMLSYHVAIAYLDCGNHAECIALMQPILEDGIDFIHIHAFLTAAYIISGKKDKAHKQAQEILRIDPNFTADNFANLIPYKTNSIQIEY